MCINPGKNFGSFKVFDIFYLQNNTQFYPRLINKTVNVNIAKM